MLYQVYNYHLQGVQATLGRAGCRRPDGSSHCRDRFSATQQFSELTSIAAWHAGCLSSLHHVRQAAVEPLGAQDYWDTVASILRNRCMQRQRPCMHPKELPPPPLPPPLPPPPPTLALSSLLQAAQRCASRPAAAAVEQPAARPQAVMAAGGASRCAAGRVLVKQHLLCCLLRLRCPPAGLLTGPGWEQQGHAVLPLLLPMYRMMTRTTSRVRRTMSL